MYFLTFIKQITKKLAGNIGETAAWMTNFGNEYGEILNSVLTTGEGAGLKEVCRGIVARYRDSGEPEPLVIYVDKDCCNDAGMFCANFEINYSKYICT